MGGFILNEMYIHVRVMIHCEGRPAVGDDLILGSVGGRGLFGSLLEMRMGNLVRGGEREYLAVCGWE